jgi:hypothetical protein
MTVLLSVALLLPAGSFTPPGAVIVAVFVIVPAAARRRRHRERRRAAGEQRSPTPREAAAPARRAAPTRRSPCRSTWHSSDVRREVVGHRRTRSPHDGPAFDATIVYVTVPPLIDRRSQPSVLLIDRSAVGVMTVLLSVAELFPAGSFTPTGAVIVAVLVIVPAPTRVAVHRERRRTTREQRSPPPARFPAPARRTARPGTSPSRSTSHP